MEEFRHVDGLASLNLSENRNIGNKRVGFLPQLEQISELSLSACGLNDAGLDPLLTMKNLRKLDLSYCMRLMDKGIRKLNAARFLEALDLRGIPRLTNATIRKIERVHLTIRY